MREDIVYLVENSSTAYAAIWSTPDSCETIANVAICGIGTWAMLPGMAKTAQFRS
jgi:uncharacterized membrane protein YoaT (DUF817 family)